MEYKDRCCGNCNKWEDGKCTKHDGNPFFKGIKISWAATNCCPLYRAKEKDYESR